MEYRLRAALGVRRPEPPTHLIELLMLQRQIEMFAGVAASSMPTVNQFFTHQSFPLKSWRSSLRSSLTHLLSSSARVKLPGRNSSFTDWDQSNTHTSKYREGFKLEDLKSDGYEGKAAKDPRMGDSEIHLTEDRSTTHEQLNGTSLGPVVTSLHR